MDLQAPGGSGLKMSRGYPSFRGMQLPVVLSDEGVTVWHAQQ
jgi:hypothetical protein